MVASTTMARPSIRAKAERCGVGFHYAAGTLTLGDVHDDGPLSGEVNSARTGTPQVRLSRNVTSATST